MSRRVRALAGRSFPWTGLDPERRNSVLLIGGIGLVVLFALALIAYGYYDDRIAPKHATVLRVGERKFSYDYLERRAHANFVLGELSKSNLAQGIADTLTRVEREEVIRQTARNDGVTVTEEELDRLLHSRLRIGFETSREELAARYRSELLRLDLSLSEYRDIMLSELLEARIRTNLQKNVPPETSYVNLGLIRTRLLAEAQDAEQRLDEGEPFAAVAASVSIDSSRDKGGDRGWTPKGSLPPKVEAAAFAFSQPGLSDVIEVEDGGFFIIEVRGRDLRKVDEAGSKQIVDYALQDMLRKTVDSAGADFNLTAGQVQKIVAMLSQLVQKQTESGA